jgi:hypothetical protein
VHIPFTETKRALLSSAQVLRIPSVKLLLLVAMVVSACVSNQPFRMGGIDKQYPNQEPNFEEATAFRNGTYRLSFVEFDEKGDFWDRRQLGKTATIISGATKPVFLVVYIHGWHHNAADRKPDGKNPGDVETFRCLLSQLAASDSVRPLQVHGVYLGWRGRLVQGPLDYFTFLSRKNAATRVAGTPVTETIFELIRQARKQPSGGSKCVVIGHSFGALVLEKAMAQALAGSMLSQDAQSRGRPFNAPADLILLVNSAAESIYAKELSDMFVRTGHRGQVNPQRPLLISITSSSDTATKGWFPRGTFLPNLFARRQYHWDDRYNYLSADVNQHEYLTTTPGHNRRLHTHRIIPLDGISDLPPAQAGSCSDENPAFKENLQHSQGLVFATTNASNGNALKWWKIEQAGPNKVSPYWIMQVPPQIINGHSPIFTAEGQAMMAALFRITNPKYERGPRQMTLSSNAY